MWTTEAFGGHQQCEFRGQKSTAVVLRKIGLGCVHCTVWALGEERLRLWILVRPGKPRLLLSEFCGISMGGTPLQVQHIHTLPDDLQLRPHLPHFLPQPLLAHRRTRHDLLTNRANDLPER